MALNSHAYYDGIEAALLADSPSPTAASLVGNRIYADQAPADQVMPFIRIALITDSPDNRLADGNNTTAHIQIDAYADRADAVAAWNIDGLVRRAIDRARLTVTGFAAVECQCSERGNPLKEAGYYRVTSRYRLFGSAS